MDITEYLDEKGVEYHTEGKNVTPGWIEMECPFCPDGDPSWHLGVNLDSELISCWRCKVKGSFIRVIMKFERCSQVEAEKILQKHTDRVLKSTEPRGTVQIPRSCELPSQAQTALLDKHNEWLISRDFNPLHIYNKYDLRCVGKTSRWKFRLIIPIYMNRKLVAFTSRDVTNKAEEAYRHASIDQCIIPVKHSLYNFDTVKQTAIVVEGVTDVWRIGDGAVATFGVKFTMPQVKLLSRLTRVFIMYDSDALGTAARLAYDLSTVVPQVEVIELESGDPADFSQDDVRELRMMVFGRI